jgi:soluble lytic murein transglycosylase
MAWLLQPRLCALRPFLLAVALAACTPGPAPAQPQEAAAAEVQTAEARQWLGAVFRANDAGSRSAGAGAPTGLARSLALWDWLRREPRTPSEAAPLGLTARFLVDHPGWPGSTAIRRRAEALAADPKTGEADAAAFFALIAPETAGGRARHALQLAAMPGREAEALEKARAAWRGGGFDEALEARLLERFGASLARADHAARADQLVWAGRTSAAARLLPLLAPEDRALIEARIALRTGAPDAAARAASVPAAARRDAGLAHDRALWAERQGRLAEAEQILASADVAPGSVTAPVTWLSKRLDMGRAAMRQGRADTAYRLLANHRTHARAEDAASRGLTERQRVSETEFLAGWLALRRLDRPADAVRHFENFTRAVTTPISLSRGFYWLGRAEKARGNEAAARAAVARAAEPVDYFYGQLAAEELGRAPALPAIQPATVLAADRAAFERSTIRQAVAMLGDMGERERQTLFVRALGDASTTPALARLAAEYGARVNRPDLPVWVWKNARATGDLSTFDLAYPRLPAGAAVPPENWVLAHAIARQESSFDRTALSSAGARGLMQLMPATAQDVARRLGLPYDAGRLFTDPAYNVALGASYIARRRADFGGSPMLAMAAYNAGIGNVRRWIAANGEPGPTTYDILDWIEMIPIYETRNYVHRVTENAVVYSLLEPRRQDAKQRASAWLR